MVYLEGLYSTHEKEMGGKECYIKEEMNTEIQSVCCTIVIQKEEKSEAEEIGALVLMISGTAADDRRARFGSHHAKFCFSETLPLHASHPAAVEPLLVFVLGT